MTAPVRLDELDAGSGPGGVIWSADPSELNVNLVVLPPGADVAAHVNREVDVLVVGLDGGGHLTVDGERHELVPPAAALVPKGASRAIDAGPHGIRYLSVHRARGALTIGPRR